MNKNSLLFLVAVSIFFLAGCSRTTEIVSQTQCNELADNADKIFSLKENEKISFILKVQKFEEGYTKYGYHSNTQLISRSGKLLGFNYLTYSSIPTIGSLLNWNELRECLVNNFACNCEEEFEGKYQDGSVFRENRCTCNNFKVGSRGWIGTDYSFNFTEGKTYKLSVTTATRRQKCNIETSGPGGISKSELNFEGGIGSLWDIPENYTSPPYSSMSLSSIDIQESSCKI